MKWVIAVPVASAFVLKQNNIFGQQLCQSYWKESFGEYMEEAQTSAPSGDGSFQTDRGACNVCLANLLTVQTCSAVQNQKCYAYNIGVGFDAQEVRGDKDDKTTLAGFANQQFAWTVASTTADASVPSGAIDCTLVMAAKEGEKAQFWNDVAVKLNEGGNRFSGADLETVAMGKWTTELAGRCAGDAGILCRPTSKFEKCCKTHSSAPAKPWCTPGDAAAKAQDACTDKPGSDEDR